MLALFPGQGAQFVGMGKSLFENFPIAKETFEEASDACSLNLKKLCFDGPESDLTLTENTQPCLLTASVAAFRVAQKEYGFKPTAVAGHSLGEYSALVAAGALPLSAAAYWVRERGKSMQEAVPAGQGTMAAILGAEDSAVEKLCEVATAEAKLARSSKVYGPDEDEIVVECIVQPANFNSPGQVVIAGSRDAVTQAIALAKTDSRFSGMKVMPLAVSAPFHCKLMKRARDRMADLFSKATSAQRPTSLLCSYVPNRTAIMTSEASVVFELLVEQVDHPVLWKQSVLELLSRGEFEAIEFGPGKVLAGLCKRITGMDGKALKVTSVGDAAGISALAALLGH